LSLEISVKKGEAKTLKFTYTDLSGDAVDVSGATFSFVVKSSKAETSYLIEKTDANFDKSGAENGIVSVILNETDLAQDPAVYFAEIRAHWSSDNSDLSKDIKLTIEQAVYHG